MKKSNSQSRTKIRANIYFAHKQTNKQTTNRQMQANKDKDKYIFIYQVFILLSYHNNVHKEMINTQNNIDSQQIIARIN